MIDSELPTRADELLKELEDTAKEGVQAPKPEAEPLVYAFSSELKEKITILTSELMINFDVAV